MGDGEKLSPFFDAQEGNSSVPECGYLEKNGRKYMAEIPIF